MRSRAAHANVREGWHAGVRYGTHEPEQSHAAFRDPSSFDLFPEISPYASGMLAVDGRHTVYWEQSGNPRRAGGLPAWRTRAPARRPCIAASSIPRFYRIVVFDQRGCGRSMPLGDLQRQHHGHLVADMEKAARPSRHPALAAVRRFVGQHAARSPTGCAIPSARRASSCAAFFLGTRAGDRMVPARHALDLPRGVARLRRAACRPTSAPICSATTIAG
jgi:hypothetical protein